MQNVENITCSSLEYGETPLTTGRDGNGIPFCFRCWWIDISLSFIVWGGVGRGVVESILDVG